MVRDRRTVQVYELVGPRLELWNGSYAASVKSPALFLPGRAVRDAAGAGVEIGQALLVLRRYATLPAALLQGRLKEQPLPVPLVVAQAGPKDPHEFWGAIGNKLRPSITLCATVAIELADAPEVVRKATEHDIRIAQL